MFEEEELHRTRGQKYLVAATTQPNLQAEQQVRHVHRYYYPSRRCRTTAGKMNSTKVQNPWRIPHIKPIIRGYWPRRGVAVLPVNSR